ncbi:MAG: hypothetical protein EAX95_13525 [Candidatus Thorarchaeota archaeon]|nr:hypothetical protein [Candidatus Thorarchaeota archaeon]
MVRGVEAAAETGPEQSVSEIERKDKWIAGLLKQPLVLYCVTGIAIALIAISYTTSVCARWGVFGFPFDDSWIHLNYARTFLEGRPFEYAEGIPSTGSSAPLWNIVLVPLLFAGTSAESVIGAVLVFSSILYTIDIVLVGVLVLEITGIPKAGMVGQIVFAFTPRVTGLMLSGMEAPLLFMILFLFLILVDRQEPKYDVLVGLLAGLAFLCRPELALLAIFCIPVRAARMYRASKSKNEWAKGVLRTYAVAGIAIAPWVIWCLKTTGFPLADTVYVKLGWGIPPEGLQIWLFYWQLWITREMTFVFVGLIVSVVLISNLRVYEVILIFSMLIGYQATMPMMALIFDARYLVPVFVLLGITFVSGCFGFAELVLRGQREVCPATWARNMTIATIIVLLLFAPTIPSYLHHEEIHANQIQNITEMQVVCAQWADSNLPDGTLIAVYDIGAIAFLTNHVIIDLVGLANPYLAHNASSPREKVSYLRAVGCDYLIFYYPWVNVLRPAFRYFNASLDLLYSVTITQNVVCGTDTMGIWQIQWNSAPPEP